MIAILLTPDSWLSTPKHPDTAPRIIRKQIETSMTKYTLLGPKYPNNSQNEVHKFIKNQKNTSLDLKVTFLVLPGVPGSSQCPPGRQSGGTKPAQRRLGTNELRYVCKKEKEEGNELQS